MKQQGGGLEMGRSDVMSKGIQNFYLMHSFLGKIYIGYVTMYTGACNVDISLKEMLVCMNVVELDGACIPDDCQTSRGTRSIYCCYCTT